jgi:hypothetical protein
MIQSRDMRQRDVALWVTRAFGIETMRKPDVRAARVVEEAVELAQAVGVTRETVERIVAYVFSRPAGEPHQEIGGVGLTLLACSSSLRLSADWEEERELRRVLALPIEHFQRRQAEKRACGITPAIYGNDA